MREGSSGGQGRIQKSESRDQNAEVESRKLGGFHFGLARGERRVSVATGGTSFLGVLVQRDFARGAVGRAQELLDVAHRLRAENYVAAYRAYLGRDVVNHDYLAVMADCVCNLADLTFAAAILNAAFHCFLLSAGLQPLGRPGFVYRDDDQHLQ